MCVTFFVSPQKNKKTYCSRMFVRLKFFRNNINRKQTKSFQPFLARSIFFNTTGIIHILGPDGLSGGYLKRPLSCDVGGWKGGKGL